VCPHPCEENCRRARVDEPVNIRALKRFAVERGKTETKEKDFSLGNAGLPHGDVVIIGAGPSGLTAAYDLVRRGFSVTVIDRHDRPGGHFYASLPLYRLPREVVDADVFAVQQCGVQIYCGLEVGRDISMDELRRKYRAVVLAVGLQRSKMLPVPGGEHPAVLPALPYLQGVNLGDPLPIGESVVVIGGGDVAMDVARTALRQGAREVTVVCVEHREQMPAHSWEVQEALEEGVKLRSGWGPKEVMIATEERIKGLAIQKVTQVFDREGRFAPRFDTSNVDIVRGDNIIMAVGQIPSLDFVRGYLELDARGNIVVDRENLSTSAEGVFACGEVAQGPGPAISAVASGHKAAERVAAYLTGKPLLQLKEPVKVIGELSPRIAEQVISRGREQLPQIAPGIRVKNFAAFEHGFNEKQALAEAGRCLRCGLGAEVDISRCIACLTCRRVCPFGVPAVESKAMISPDACQACGICAAACPAGAITVSGLTKDTWGGIWRESAQSGDPPIKIYACRREMGGKIVPGFERELPGLGSSILTVLPCTGALRRDRVLKDFGEGGFGVVVVSCNDGCAKGSMSAVRYDAEIEGARKLCVAAGLDGGRLALIRDDRKDTLLKELVDFAQRITAMGPPWKK